ncbi:MAG: 30S ribosomal protein S17 [Clostridiales bacterium]|nr:30S ribosomal protein S17 [Clostridiales bacterium]
MEKKNKKTMQGIVVSNKMDKTVVVAVTTSAKHGMYNKIIKKTSKYKAHDGNNECGIGDRVSIEECRPLSKDKRWNVASILERAPGATY